MTTALPNATPRACSDCPWRRNATKGWLGPWTADEWARLAHSDEPIACHQTIVEDDDWEAEGVLQCRGAATYRANIAKSPRNPEVITGPVDSERVFGILFIILADSEAALFGVLICFISGGLGVTLFITAHSWAWNKDVRAQLQTNPHVERVLALHVWTRDNKNHMDFLDPEDHICSAIFYHEGPRGHRYYFVDEKSIRCHKEVIPHV